MIHRETARPQAIDPQEERIVEIRPAPPTPRASSEAGADEPAASPGSERRGSAGIPQGIPQSNARPSGLFDTIRRGDPFQAAVHDSIAHETSIVDVEGFNLWYGKSQALFDVSMRCPAGKVTALIGPSGCGKSTLLRSVNRMNDLIESVRVAGGLRLAGQDIYHRSVDVIELRKRIGMVFQKPNPFPMSIFENVVYPLRIDGERDRTVLKETCEASLRSAGLWEEVKERLDSSALALSGGQQQRLCIARAIASDPEVLLLDEPCSALDPIATGRIEELIHELKGDYSILIVTHNMQQASRVSDLTAFMYLGRLVEFGPTEDIFLQPRLKETEDYVTGRFG